MIFLLKSLKGREMNISTVTKLLECYDKLSIIKYDISSLEPHRDEIIAVLESQKAELARLVASIALDSSVVRNGGE